MQLRAVGLVDELLAMTAPSDPKYQYLMLLRHQLETDERQMRDAQEVLEQFEDAYAKLTETASKIGMYLGPLENSKKVFLAVGDGEYVGNVDPKLATDEMTIGDRVIINDAFAVVQVLPPHVAGPLVKVGEVLGDGRVRVGGDAQGQNSRIIGLGEALQFADLKAGDEVRLEPTGKLAMEHFPKAESKDFFLEEVPQVPWEKIGGQDEVIEIIRDAIEKPLLYPELYERFGKRPLKGILLYGPPGCGKTLIGKATAYNLTKEFNQQTGQNLKEYFMYINGPKILNMWLGESERMVREIFAQAREKSKEGHLVFIFIDEFAGVIEFLGP